MNKYLSIVSLVAALAVTSYGQGAYTPATAENPSSPGASQNAQSVTNGQAVTLVGGFNAISPVLSTNGATDTVTLADPTAINQECTIYVPAPQTNLLAIADSGNFLGSGTLTLGTNDVAKLIAVSATQWALASTSNN